jgi:SAM-dependent methyltransferase
MTAAIVPRHPAKFSAPIIAAAKDEMSSWLATLDRSPVRVLDPFAGVGRCHLLADLPGVDTVGVELEPEWATAHSRTIVGSALALPFDDDTFDALFTSPCYGNRMADHHDAKDPCRCCDGGGCGACDNSGLSKRHTYRHALGRQLTAGSAAAMQWGTEYRVFHELAWREALRVLRPGALLLVNVSNHIRSGVEQPVVEWHLTEFLRLGCRLRAAHRIETRRNRQGANRDARVDGELLLVMNASSNPNRRLL